MILKLKKGSETKIGKYIPLIFILEESIHNNIKKLNRQLKIIKIYEIGKIYDPRKFHNPLR